MIRRKPFRPRNRNPESASDRRHWEKVKELGCVARGCGAQHNITRHHCGTRGGGRKDHKKVIPLCWYHHLGEEGIDGKVICTKKWEARYGTEIELLARVAELLAMP